MVELGVADLSVLGVARRLELGDLVEADPSRLRPGAVSASSGSTGPVSRAIRARRIGMPTITTTAARIASTITNCSTS